MSVKEDVLFCKIAISSGLVKETDAQKVLSLCQKREIETGQRPVIGAVFQKYNLLGRDDVQRVYQAIKKRTGGSAGPERVAAQPRARGTGSRRPAESAKSKVKIDQNTLIMGIGSVVLVLGIVGFMLMKLIETKPGPAKPNSSPAADASGAGGSAPAAAPAPAPAPKPEPKGPTDAPKEIVGEILMVISDQKRDNSENPAEGLKRLLEEKTKLEKRNYNLPKQLQDAIKEFEVLVKEGKTAAPGAEPKPDEKAEPKGEEKPEPPAEPVATPPETKPEESNSAEPKAAEPDAAEPAAEEAK